MKPDPLFYVSCDHTGVISKDCNLWQIYTAKSSTCKYNVMWIKWLKQSSVQYLTSKSFTLNRIQCILWGNWHKEWCKTLVPWRTLKFHCIWLCCIAFFEPSLGEVGCRDWAVSCVDSLAVYSIPLQSYIVHFWIVSHICITQVLVKLEYAVVSTTMGIVYCWLWCTNLDTFK